MIIDALDTKHIMGLTSEYEHARLSIADSLSFDQSGLLNAFEVTICVLGGLLSAYYLSLNPLFLDKTANLTNCTMPIFETSSGIPISFIDLKERVAHIDNDSNRWSSLSEVATLQLELQYLGHLTDDYTYWQAAGRVRHCTLRLQRLYGDPYFTGTRGHQNAANGNTLVPIFIRYIVPLSFLPGAGSLQSKTSLPDPKMASSSPALFDWALAVTRSTSMSYLHPFTIHIY